MFISFQAGYPLYVLATDGASSFLRHWFNGIHFPEDAVWVVFELQTLKPFRVDAVDVRHDRIASWE